MENVKSNSQQHKAVWVQPKLVELNETAADVHFGFAPGTDGDTGISTSMS